MKSSVTVFKKLIFSFIAVAFLPFMLYAGTTGKLSGKVTDETGEPVIGANIIVEGTYMGAAADIEGYYYINNIPPGEYRVIVSAVGYQKTIVENVVIKIDLTFKLDVKLNSTSVQLKQEVVVRAERPLVQKDLTSTSATISSGDIKMMPVESVGQIVNLQAGVVDGHFRGGRSNEVSYLIDGVSVTDAFNNTFGVQVENSSIRAMEVITGTFNAEYGQVMSGVVNIVTQEGSQKFEGSVSGYVGNFVTSNTDIFRNLDKVDFTKSGSQDLQFSLSGPVAPLKNLTFFTTGRYNFNRGHLFGKRVYNVTDNVPIFPDPMNNEFYINRNTGDGEWIAMDPSRKWSFNGKLTYSLPYIKVSYSLFWDDNRSKYYSHDWSWTPDAMVTDYMTNIINTVQFSHYPSQSTFQTLKFSSNLHKYKGYLFEDPYDPRYVDPQRGTALSDYTYRSGGNQGYRYFRNTLTYLTQWQLSSQVSKEHKIGIGAEARLHRIFSHNLDLINVAMDGEVDSLTGEQLFLPGYPDLGTVTELGRNQQYEKKPVEISAYIQDKMEYDIMIINAGVRFDYFDPNSRVPVDLRNLTKDPNFPGAGEFKDTKAKYQISPRFGASFPITDQGIIRFSYGHFFQIPSFEQMYDNSDYFIRQGADLSSTIGNPDLKPQQTVQYEIGLQQVLFPNLALDVTVYYRDIRNLLGMEIIKTYQGNYYGRYINRDYGNTRGFVITLDKRFADYFGLKLDYTYQIAEGNASDPRSVFNNSQANPPVEEPKRVVPLDWDQRNTLNLTANVGNPGDWNLGFIFRYNSGTPYDEDTRVSNGVRFENGGVRPETFYLDLLADKTFEIGSFSFNAYLWVYNLLDIKNETGVYGTTGRATSDLGPVFSPVEIIGMNTLDEYIKNPSMYSAPREIRLGFGFGF